MRRGEFNQSGMSKIQLYRVTLLGSQRRSVAQSHMVARRWWKASSLNIWRPERRGACSSIQRWEIVPRIRHAVRKGEQYVVSIKPWQLFQVENCAWWRHRAAPGLAGQ